MTRAQTHHDLDLDEALLGLAFDEPGGPLLAVVGLCGGAGATTLAHLIASAATRESQAAVLAIDAGGPTAGLSTYARVRSADSLLGFAASLARGESIPSLFAETAEGLRIIATDPRFEADAPVEAVERLLTDARHAHGLTVVDCGSLTNEVGRAAVRLATHVAWVLPATVGGTARATRLLRAFNGFVDAAEVVCARHDLGDKRAPMSDLTALADRRGAPLALIPHIDEFERLDIDERIEQAAVAFQALAGVLR